MWSKMKMPIIYISIILAVLFLIAYAFRTYGNDYVTEIIRSMVDSQIQTIENNQKEQLKTIEKGLKNVQAKIAESQKNSDEIKKRVNDVEEKIKTRKPPETSGELRDRLIKSNLKPVN